MARLSVNPDITPAIIEELNIELSDLGLLFDPAADGALLARYSATTLRAEAFYTACGGRGPVLLILKLRDGHLAGAFTSGLPPWQEVCANERNGGPAVLFDDADAFLASLSAPLPATPNSPRPSVSAAAPQPAVSQNTATTTATDSKSASFSSLPSSVPSSDETSTRRPWIFPQCGLAAYHHLPAKLCADYEGLDFGQFDFSIRFAGAYITPAARVSSMLGVTFRPEEADWPPGYESIEEEEANESTKEEAKEHVEADPQSQAQPHQPPARSPVVASEELKAGESANEVMADEDEDDDGVDIGFLLFGRNEARGDEEIEYFEVYSIRRV